MTDDFLSNSNYYNKGGLNNKPKEPRPIPPKGQSPDDKYELIFKQLIHEHNELRKYIVDICKLLGIDTSQSILGANCLEFYTVLCNTAENKIGDLQNQLKRKEEEYYKYKQTLKTCAELCGKLQNYMRAIDKIMKYCNECNLKYESIACDILNIIDETI